MVTNYRLTLTYLDHIAQFCVCTSERERERDHTRCFILLRSCIVKHLICVCLQPDSVKLNAIIEKTALFISQQGAQMEILLKMKQANNPQFQFLSFDSLLHPYYRHLLMAIKTGRYRPKTQEQDKEGLYMLLMSDTNLVFIR